MTALLRAILAALVYRLRGGGFVALGSTQAARATWAAMTAALVWPVTAPWWAIPASAALSWLALISTGHGEHQDMGRMPPGYSADGKPYELATWPVRLLDLQQVRWPFWARELFDGTCMLWIGLLRGSITMGAVWLFDWRFAAAWTAGNALMGPAYWLGWRAPWTLPGLAARSTEWGELFTGLAVGLAVAAYLSGAAG